MNETMGKSQLGGVEKEPQVIEWLNRLGMAVKGLCESSETLRGRLSPVLSDPLPKACEDHGDTEQKPCEDHGDTEQLVDLAERIRAAVMVLEVQRNINLETYRRLEI